MPLWIRQALCFLAGHSWRELPLPPSNSRVDYCEVCDARRWHPK